MLAVVIAVSATAYAGSKPRLRHSVAVTLMMHGSQNGTFGEAGAGPDVELALGRDRHQVFGELTLSLVGAGRAPMKETALYVRTGAGLRWIARRFDADEASFDLVVEAVAGVEAIEWRDGRLVRPDVGFGAGWQVGLPRVKIRIITRAIVTPPIDEPMLTSCRGNCPGSSGGVGFGFMGLFGAAW